MKAGEKIRTEILVKARERQGEGGFDQQARLS
jgi:hypothetical protein